MENENEQNQARTEFTTEPGEQIYLAVDNGVSGSLAALNSHGQLVDFRPTPVFLSQDYTKAVKNINRVDTKKLGEYFQMMLNLAKDDPERLRVFVERPLVNPSMFKATGSALRALEATLISLESLNIAYRFVDSREWQKVVLPSGLKGRDLLKQASMDIGIRLFPLVVEKIRKQKDADSLLMAEAARRGRW